MADRVARRAPPPRWADDLTLYLLHVLVFKLFVEWTGAVGATGLDTALVLALGFWVFAIAAGAWWQRLFGTGPVERLYRWLGG